MDKSKILIIDDDDDFCESTKIMLKSEDYDVITAGDGLQGLSIARQYKPDVIFLDIMMPGEDGYSVCRQIKEDPSICDIPVIIATSMGRKTESDYLKKIAKYHKADGYLEKPLSRDTLIDAISRAVSKKGKKVRSEKTKKQILIIDDDIDVLASLELVFQESGYGVYTAESAIEGMKLARAFHPDAIILDVILPDKDGYSACYELKKDTATHEIPVLILTALPSNLSEPGYGKNIARDHMADAYATKPITPDELLTKIESLIAPPS
jgi:adenylate cyclase